jgi:hypothetical protein
MAELMAPDLHLLRERVIALLPVGRENAVPAEQIAFELGTTTRLVGVMVEQAILVDGYAVGSLCGPRHGYFLIRDAADLEAGVGHTVKRLSASAKRVRAVRRNYLAMPNHEQTNIFDELEMV